MTGTEAVGLVRGVGAVDLAAGRELSGDCSATHSPTADEEDGGVVGPLGPLGQVGWAALAMPTQGTLHAAQPCA